jgi:hypothetical protein
MRITVNIDFGYDAWHRKASACDEDKPLERAAHPQRT